MALVSTPPQSPFGRLRGADETASYSSQRPLLDYWLGVHTQKKWTALSVVSAACLLGIGWVAFVFFFFDSSANDNRNMVDYRIVDLIQASVAQEIVHRVAGDITVYTALLLAASLSFLVLAVAVVFLFILSRSMGDASAFFSKQINWSLIGAHHHDGDERFNPGNERKQDRMNVHVPEKSQSSSRTRSIDATPSPAVEYSSPGESVIHPGSGDWSSRIRRRGFNARKAIKLQDSTPQTPPSGGALARLAQSRSSSSPHSIPFNLGRSQRHIGGELTPYTPSADHDRWDENSIICRSCRSPISPFEASRTYSHRSSPLIGNYASDEAAFSLLSSLPVDSDGSVGTPQTRQPNEYGVSSNSRNLRRSAADYIDDWVENLTQALCKHVRKEVIEALETNSTKLKELPGGIFTQELLDLALRQEGSGGDTDMSTGTSFLKNPSAMSPSLAMPTNRSSGSGRGSSLLEQAHAAALNLYNQEAKAAVRPSQSFSLLSSFSANPDVKRIQAEVERAVATSSRLVEERTRLDRALVLPSKFTGNSGCSKAVILERLKSLFGTSSNTYHRLSDYQWDRVSPPFDADIVVSVACMYLDRVFRSSSGQESFAQLHIRNVSRHAEANSVDEKFGTFDIPGVTANQWWGLQRSIIPAPNGQGLVPHFNVVVHGTVWNVRSGRHNAMQAVALLMYGMKSYRVMGVEALDSIIVSRR